MMDILVTGLFLSLLFVFGVFLWWFICVKSVLMYFAHFGFFKWCLESDRYWWILFVVSWTRLKWNYSTNSIIQKVPFFWRVSSPKNEHSVTIYCHLFIWEHALEVNGHQTCLVTKVLFCSTEERKSFRFQTTNSFLLIWWWEWSTSSSV